ncbi:amino acid ABC transporter substrate-binding protein, PAAT family [Limimonas halophila]|uniref:Amino acid ABC transporter substrate-binding protein, PAAT family n=1 Tax=Limimonas halophila TaxID=1082479 RepID=A0A1G7U2B5_9PROT|nr:transporter substrate-binding domain-containing protein [Limimonas halophila]SDG41451.1 amino acid ABC transporter substrate-binding protein, PAAT family [Limimonas halophila]
MGTGRRLAARVIALLALLAPAGAACAGEAPHGTVTVATLSDYPPYSGENLPHRGASTHIVRAAFQRAGYDPEITVMPWSRALAMTKRGHYDALANVWHREHRTEFFAYAGVLATNRLVFVKPAGSGFTYQRLADLRGKLVGTVRDYSYPKPFLQAESFHRHPVETLRRALVLTARGRFDLAIGDALVVQHTINTELPTFGRTLSLTERALAKDPMHLVVSRKIPDHAEIVRRFNAALTRMRADGTRTEILRAHGLRPG